MRSITTVARRTVVAACVTLLAAAGLIACSSNSTSTSGSGPDSAADAQATAACLTKANAFLKIYDQLPTSLGAGLPPLSKAPTPGKTVVKLVGPIPSDNDTYLALAEAAKSVGWQAQKISHNGTVEDVGQKFEQAVAGKPAVIDISGWPVDALQRQIADAKKAGIVVVLSSVPDVPTGYPGFSAVMNGPATTKLRGEINAYEFMRASKCAGSAAIFTLPFPVLKLSTNAFTTTVKANCPKCSVSYNEVQTKDIGTPAAVTAVVSKLQSDPKVKYLYTIIANLATGMDTALSQAGITGVSIFGQTPDENSIKALRAKTNTWWVGLTPQVTGWSEFYLGLRAIDTGAAVQDTAAIPQTVLTQDNVPAGAGVPALPADYVEEFTKLYQGA